MRRVYLTILVYLLFGAIVNIGVAWWLAARPQVRRFPTLLDKSVSGQRFRNPSDPQNHSEQVIYLGCGICEGWERYPTPGLDLTPLLDPEEWERLAPRAAALRDGSPLTEFKKRRGERNRDYTFSEHIAGWPCWSLRGYLVKGWVSAKVYESSGRVSIPESWRVEGGPEWLPFMPVWPGFYANTALYATGLWLLTLGPIRALRGVRAWMRARRGSCLTCGYDLRGTPDSSVCSECGAPAGSGA